MNALDWADPTLTGRLCLTLLHSLWQIALLACAAWAVGRVWQRHSPQRTYVACVLLLCVGLCALPATFLLVDVPVAASPKRPAPIVSQTAEPLPSSSFDRSQGVERSAHAAAPKYPPQQFVAPPVVVKTRWPTSEATVERPTVERPAAEKVPAWLSFTPWMAGAYFMGVMAMLLRLLISIRRAGRLIESATMIDGGPIVETLRGLARTWSMKVAPVLALAESVVVPKVVGVVRPTILLPSSALTGLTPDELELVLTHELAHIRRHDMWVNLLQRIAESALFFHPGLWYLSCRISVLREYCCDEMACVAADGDSESAGADVRMRYALALLRVVELMQDAPEPKRAAALAMAGRSPSELRRRIARLFGEPLCEPVRMSRTGMFVAGTTVLLVVLGSVVWNPAAQSRGQDDKKTAETHAKAADAQVKDDPQVEDEPAPEEPDAPAEDIPARISGRIVLEDGSPAAVKGRIYFNSSHDNVVNSSTGPECTDQFSISLPAGTVWLKYYAQDHAPAWVGPIEIGPGELRDDVKIVLKPGFSELVKVTNEQGAPVAGATVIAHPEINNSATGPIVEQTTDAEGEVWLEHLADTRYALRITAAGYQPLRTAPLRVEVGEVLRPTMIRSRPNTGVIRYADGTPAAGAKLRAKYELQSDGHGVGFGNAGEGFWGTVVATADAHGRFRLDQLTNGSRYLFIVEAVDGARAIVRDLQAGQEDVQIVLPRRRDLVVKITGDLSQLSPRRGKPYLSFRQRVVFRPTPDRRVGELVGADVPVEPTADGGMAIFRGLAVDLEPGEDKQQVDVILPHNRARKTVDLNVNGNTLVEFDLGGESPADAAANSAEKPPKFPSANTARSPATRGDLSAIWFHSGDFTHFMVYHDGFLPQGLEYDQYENTEHSPVLWKFQGALTALGRKQSGKFDPDKQHRLPIVFEYRPPGFLLQIAGKVYDLSDGRVFFVAQDGRVQQLAIDPPPVDDRRKKIDSVAEKVHQAVKESEHKTPANEDATAETQRTQNGNSPTVAERAVTKMVLEFFQNRSRRMIPALMVDAGTQTLVIAAGPATVVPDGTPAAIDRSYLILPGQPRVPVDYQKESTAELFVYRAPPGLTQYAGDAPAELAVGDELTMVDYDRKAGETAVVPNVARVTKLDEKAELNLHERQIRHRYTKLVEVDRVLPEGTPLFNDGKLAGLTLLGTRFLGEDAKKSYVVPADRISALAAEAGKQFKPLRPNPRPAAQPQAVQSAPAAPRQPSIPPLQRRISLDIEGISRHAALRLACEKAKVPLKVDQAALAEANIKLDEPLSLVLTDDTLYSALSAICGFQPSSVVMYPSVIYAEFRGGTVHLTTMNAWQQWTRSHLPDWLRPLQNEGLIARVNEEGEVVSITASRIATDEHLAQMKSLPKLRELYIEATENVTAAGLQHLAEMKSLEKLTLYSVNTAGPGLGDAAIAAVVGLTELRELEISECGLTDDGTKLLEDMPQLTRLRLYQEGRLTDAALASIGTLTQLKHLDLTSFVATERLGRMRFSADGIRQLAGLKNLESLHLYGHAVPADALVFPELRSLSIGGFEVDNDAAARIAGFRNLESLSLRETRITDEGLSNIATLPELRRLELHSGILTDRGIAELKNLPSLEHLDLRVLKATGGVLRDIAEIKTLTRLDLTSVQMAPARGNLIVNEIPISDAPQTTNALGTAWKGEGWGDSLRYLKTLPHLETVWLYNFPALDGLKDVKQLRSVVLTMCNVDGTKLDELSEALPEATISSMTGADGRVRLPKRLRQQQQQLKVD